MTADENVAIMQRAYDAFNTGDVNTLTELFDESAVWHLPGRSSMANDYQDREATLAYFGQIGRAFPDATFCDSLTRKRKRVGNAHRVLSLPRVVSSVASI